MKLIKWEPFSELDRFFENKFMPSFSRIGWDLGVDVYEEGGNVITKMNLPGIKPDELDISLEDDLLTISGKREEEKEIEKKDYYSKEIRRGSFSRIVSLPKAVDEARAEAAYENGVLVVTMPAVAGAEKKGVKIMIKK